MSHINAHTTKGEEWLEQVVLTGLRKGGGDSGWAIEVHGNDPAVEENDNEEDPPEAPGPAVYLIFKAKLEKDETNNNNSDPPTIPLKFFNY